MSLILLAGLAFAGPFDHEVNPIESDCDDGAINASITCDIVGINEWTNASLTFVHTYAAATGFTCELWSIDRDLTYSRIQTQSISAGTITLSDATVSAVTGATKTIGYNLPINYHGIRLVCIGTGSPTASDKLTVDLRLTHRALK